MPRLRALAAGRRAAHRRPRGAGQRGRPALPGACLGRGGEAAIAGTDGKLAGLRVVSLRTVELLCIARRPDRPAVEPCRAVAMAGRGRIRGHRRVLGQGRPCHLWRLQERWLTWILPGQGANLRARPGSAGILPDRAWTGWKPALPGTALAISRIMQAKRVARRSRVRHPRRARSETMLPRPAPHPLW